MSGEITINVLLSPSPELVGLLTQILGEAHENCQEAICEESVDHMDPIESNQEELRQQSEGSCVDEFLCSECGCLVDLHKMISQELTGDEMVCESCFHSDEYQSRGTKGCEQEISKTEQPLLYNPPSNEWRDLTAVKNLQCRIHSDSVELRKDGVDCDKWSLDVIYTLLDLNNRSRSSEIKSLTKDVKYGPLKSTALNQLILAIESREVVLPGGDE
ncbi:hypothetical protein V7O67_05320 [Methanolobus sp. ZRKC4]|uniref:hypothetical protein n=1 Tax=Methanolobus sp. ZRKC4 TaxID=3125787 RepID=UPI0032439F2C